MIENKSIKSKARISLRRKRIASDVNNFKRREKLFSIDSFKNSLQFNSNPNKLAGKSSVNDKEISASLQSIGSRGLEGIADFKSLEFKDGTKSNETYNLWNHFLKFIQSK